MQYFANRPPLLIKIEWENNNISKNLSLINVHYKCCGDDSIDIGNYDDEEFRRLKASESLYNYIYDNLTNDNVIIAGDWNDAIQEPALTNTFQIFIDDSLNFKFADMTIAEGEQENWSWQGWGSSYPAIHFDHILINKNLFDELDNNAIVNTIRIEEYFENSMADYDKYVSDHRPLYFKFTP
jgi:exonuclease III